MEYEARKIYCSYFQDSIPSIILILFAWLCLTEDPEHFRKGLALDPLLFPRIVLSLIIILEAIHLFINTTKIKGAFSNKQEYYKDFNIEAQGAKYVLIFAIVVFIYVTSINYIGFIIATIVVNFILLFLFNERIIWKLIIFNIFVIIFYLLFFNILNIPLPQGSLFY